MNYREFVEIVDILKERLGNTGVLAPGEPFKILFPEPHQADERPLKDPSLRITFKTWQDAVEFMQRVQFPVSPHPMRPAADGNGFECPVLLRDTRQGPRLVSNRDELLRALDDFENTLNARNNGNAAYGSMPLHP